MASSASVALLATATPRAGSGASGDAALSAKRVQAADGSVISTPEYNHGYPGALKTAIDTAREEWHAKPVGFVSYGGIAGGLRAVEQLRLVFAELHTITVRQVVSLHWVHDLFEGNGMLTDHRAPAAADKMLAQLAWWAQALRNARTEEVLRCLTMAAAPTSGRQATWTCRPT
jgi:NAD(P)H-dependent FMN reductase